MKKSLSFLALTASVVVLSGFYGGGAAKVGTPAPTFALPGVDGKTHDLSKYKGKFVVLEWINRDCPVVKGHYKRGDMQATQAKAKEMGNVVWIGICSSAPGKQGHLSAEEYVQNLKDTNSKADTILLDPDGKVGKMYDATTTPHMMVIDPKGILLYNGAIDDRMANRSASVPRNHVLEALKEAKAGKAVSVPTSQPYGCDVKYAN